MTFACISTGAPRLYSVMQIDQVFQEPRDCAQRYFMQPFLASSIGSSYWRYIQDTICLCLMAILTVRVISSIRMNITWTWVFVYWPFTSQPNTMVITNWEFNSSRPNGAKCTLTNRPSWVQRVDLPPLRRHAVIWTNADLPQIGTREIRINNVH